MNCALQSYIGIYINRNAVIPAWMPETSHRDVKLWSGMEPKSSRRGIARLPSLALDSGIHAGMTGLNILVYNEESWSLEPA